MQYRRSITLCMWPECDNIAHLSVSDSPRHRRAAGCRQVMTSVSRRSNAFRSGIKQTRCMEMKVHMINMKLNAQNCQPVRSSRWNNEKQGCGAVTFLVGSGSGEAFRLRLRVKLFGSGSGQNVPAPAPAPMLKSSYEPYLTSNTIFKNDKYQNTTSY